MMRREWWLVTPQGRMASNSGCTEVLVDGASTANLPRGASESVTALECHRHPHGRTRHDEPRQSRSQAEVPDRSPEPAGREAGGEGEEGPGRLHQANEAIPYAQRRRAREAF